jgi:hypothetical protein
MHCFSVQWRAQLVPRGVGDELVGVQFVGGTDERGVGRRPSGVGAPLDGLDLGVGQPALQPDAGVLGELVAAPAEVSDPQDHDLALTCRQVVATGQHVAAPFVEPVQCFRCPGECAEDVQHAHRPVAHRSERLLLLGGHLVVAQRRDARRREPHGVTSFMRPPGCSSSAAYGTARTGHGVT